MCLKKKKKKLKVPEHTAVYIFLFCSCSLSDLTSIFGNITNKLKVHSCCANCYGFIWKYLFEYICIILFV